MVGPTGVAVGVDPALDTPPTPPVETVPFDGGAGDPVEPEPLPVPVPNIIERVLEGQYVVVYMEVVIVEPILEIVVTVAVVLLETPVPDTDEVAVDWNVEDAVLVLL